ncbi:MAG: hypothetical protein ACR2NU_04030 [Aeoliella sp.]
MNRYLNPITKVVARATSLAAIVALLLVVLPAQATAEEADSSAAETPSHHPYKLGEFSIKDFRPVEHEKVKLKFTVYVEVVDGREERFEQLWDDYEHRVRDQVITAARLVPTVDYDDPTLRALRRRIHLRLRRAVPELPIDGVFVSDFSFLVD